MTFTGYRLYGGLSLGEIDFDSPLASCAAGDSYVDADLSAQSRCDGCYVLRSIIGDIESPDISCKLMLGLDDQDQLVSSVPAAPEDFNIRAISASTFRLSCWISDYAPGDTLKLYCGSSYKDAKTSIWNFTFAINSSGYNSASFSLPGNRCWYILGRVARSDGTVSPYTNVFPAVSGTVPQLGATRLFISRV